MIVKRITKKSLLKILEAELKRIRYEERYLNRKIAA
jgi:hypothetical protein